jgi:hypothetical protein
MGPLFLDFPMTAPAGIRRDKPVDIKSSRSSGYRQGQKEHPSGQKYSSQDRETWILFFQGISPLSKFTRRVGL